MGGEFTSGSELMESSGWDTVSPGCTILVFLHVFMKTLIAEWNNEFILD